MTVPAPKPPEPPPILRWTEPCPACARDCEWVGTYVTPGGSTAYRQNCRCTSITAPLLRGTA